MGRGEERAGWREKKFGSGLGLVRSTTWSRVGTRQGLSALYLRPQLSTSLLRERKRLLACWRAILVSSAPQIHFFCLLHCQTETDWGASVCTAKHANLIFLSTS